VDTSWSDPRGTLAANVLATHHLLDALRRADLRCRVLVTASAAVYAPLTTPLREDARLAPDNPYAVSKLAQEGLALRAVEEDGLEVIVTRPFNHTGPRQTPAFVTSSFARQIALAERGAIEPILHVGNLEAARDLTDVRDMVRAYSALADAGVSGEVYNVASGVAHTVRSILDRLVALATIPVRVETDAARFRPTDRPMLVGDASKLHALTGWTPAIPVERTLYDLLEYWRRAPIS
jgi:GDP-4-dehydro-6-deoxy-D-mannose reductase